MTDNHLGFLDQLRGLAILLVVVTHLGVHLPVVSAFGQFGVQLFFLVSAYTLALSWQKRSTEAKPIGAFFVRRYFRIAPAYISGIALYAILAAQADTLNIELSVTQKDFTFWNVAVNMLLLNGFVPSANNSVVPGGWSIGTEMAFYLLFPVLAAVTSGFRNRSMVIWLAVASIPIALFATSIMQTLGLETGRNTFAYYSLPCQLGAFAAGLLAKQGSENADTPQRMLLGVAVSLCCLLVMALIWKSESKILQSLLPSLAAFVFFAPTVLLRQAELRLKILEWIGKVSFSLYLVHFAAIWLCTPLMHDLIPADMPLLIRFAGHLFAVLMISLPLAAVSQRYIEAPGQRLGSLVVARMQHGNSTGA